MTLATLRFLSVTFVALALAPSMAHLLELPHKIHMSAQDYLTVQQIYRGWALLGIVVLVALLSTLALVFVERSHSIGVGLTVAALVCIVLTQVVFWVYTYPVNAQTHDWTTLPQNWMALRKQWEYSHAVASVLNLLALIALLVHVIAEKPRIG